MKVVLGSRSPQRRELLSWVVEERDLIVMPPLSSDELSFHRLHADADIAERLQQITEEKFDDVAAQLRRLQSTAGVEAVCLLCADTVIVADTPAELRIVLGQPDDKHGAAQVRQWFQDYLSGRVHEVWTCFRCGVIDGQNSQTADCQTVRTRVELAELGPELIDWYVGTGEYRGKAGGYAIQGQASVFVKAVQGSLTNVIGLPVLEISAELTRHGVPLKKTN